VSEEVHDINLLNNDPELPQAVTAFMIVVEKDGTLTVHTRDFPALEIERLATLTDVQTFCGQAVHEVTQRRFWDSLVALAPNPEPPSEAVARAMKKRAKKVKDGD
jgi:hypothetical protein